MGFNAYWDKKHLTYAMEDWVDKPTIFATQIREFLPQGGKLLDLGAGQGQDSHFFAREGFIVYCTDFSRSALDLAKKKTPPDLIDRIIFEKVDLAEPLPYDPQSFDVVYSHLSLHFFSKERTQTLFDEIFNILKPGAIFATLVNTVEDSEFGKGTELDEHYYVAPSGLFKRFFTPETLSQFTTKFKTLLLDNKGETYKDTEKNLIRFVGKKE